jgi:predicted nuclease of predicted toxin-antitoxin system
MVKPKFLLDENIGTVVAEGLRGRGYDVKSILEEASGLDDKTVLACARKERRILVTLDRDFGRLVFLQSHKHVGVIYVRLVKESPDNVFAVLQTVLKQYGSKIRGKFVTVSEGAIRIR